MVDHTDCSNGFINASETWDWDRLCAVAHRETHRILRDEWRSHDAAQDAVLRAWRHAASCRVPDRPEVWVRAIARREALRHAARSASGPAAAETESALDVLAGSSDMPTADVLDVRVAARRTLAPRDRDLVLRRYWLGQSDAEIAQRLAMPIGTVKTRLHRARSVMRASLSGSSSAGASS